MRPPRNTPRIRDYVTLLLRGWLVIVAVSLLCVGVGWILWETGDRTYVSTAKVFSSTDGSATPLDAYYGQLNAVGRNVTVEQIALSPQVTMRTIDQLRLPDAPADLAARITVDVGTTAVIDVHVSGADADSTQRTANAVVLNMLQVSREMNAVDSSSPDLVLIDPAGPAERQGTWWKSSLRAAILGAGLSVILVLAYGLIRDKVLGTGHIGVVVDEAVTGRNE